MELEVDDDNGVGDGDDVVMIVSVELGGVDDDKNVEGTQSFKFLIISNQNQIW